MCRSLLVLLCAIGTSAGVAQTNRYFVFFKDKTGTPYTLTQPADYLSAKSIARRQQQQISLNEKDLPVNPAYVQQVRDVGVATFFTSKWFNGVLIQATETEVPALEALSCVQHVELVAPGQRLSNGRTKKIRARNQTESDEPANLFQLQQLGLTAMHQQGYRGESIAIAVFDAGFQGVDVTAPFALLTGEGRLKHTYNFVTNTPNVFTADDHGTEVLSVMAAYSEGLYTGGAYKADFYLYLTEDVASEYRIEEFNWTFAAEKADSAGVQIINSSLGYNLFDNPAMNYTTAQLDGATAIVTRAARMATERGMLVVCSAGNEGSVAWKFVTPPADAAGVLATGAITAAATRSPFSSIGPTADGRLKPDVVALGSGTTVIRASGALGTTSGTSLASPLVASLAAGVWQSYPNLTAAEVYNALTQSASQSSAPDNLLGYGIPHFQAVVNYLTPPPQPQTLSVFPNPVVGNTFFIQVPEIEDPIEVVIFDSKGSKVSEVRLQVNWQNNPFEYDLATLQAGLYYVRLKAGNRQATVRIMKQ
ncbi:MAG: S8 family serine peptidase [Cyclobacteriaceae bacterium]|nr:S8 family serine peptidase [Cyclobacteriaceae bacterium]